MAVEREFIVVSAKTTHVPGGMEPMLVSNAVPPNDLVKAIQSLGIFANSIGQVFNFSKQAKRGDHLRLARGHVSVVIFCGNPGVGGGCLKSEECREELS